MDQPKAYEEIRQTHMDKIDPPPEEAKDMKT